MFNADRKINKISCFAFSKNVTLPGAKPNKSFGIPRSFLSLLL